MIIGNKALRDHAQPFISEFIESSTVNYGNTAINSPSFCPTRTIAIPMTQPEKGDVVEAYLFMEMAAPSNMGLSVRLGVGYFTANNVIPETSYTDAYIAEQHRKITGTDTPFTVAASGTLIIDADLTKAIPHNGDSTFLSDGFVLLVTFQELPAVANGYNLNKFKLNCSAQIGLGT